MKNIINEEANTKKHFIIANLGLASASMSGILGAVTFFCFWPKPSPILVLAILATALLGIFLGVLIRKSGLGKPAMIVGGINATIWLAVGIAVQFTNG